jgi:hypothetical protein
MIESIQIEQIAAIVRRAGLAAPTLAALREHFSPLHFSTCLEDELGADEPFLTDEHFHLLSRRWPRPLPDPDRRSRVRNRRALS